LAANDPDRRAIQDHERVRRLLDRAGPGLRRVTLLLDTIDVEHLAKVENAIDHTPRYDPMRARIQLAQGIELDPEHPHAAVVYLVVMNDDEHDQFRRNLDSELPGAILAEDTSAPEPALVTQLADAGHLEIDPGIPRLGHPPAGVKSHLALPDGQEPDVIPIGPADRADVAGRGRSAAGKHVAEVPRESHALPSKSLVYLVWVTTARRS
jgi:hypothetical protein